jgi:acyl carrier protein
MIESSVGEKLAVLLKNEFAIHLDGVDHEKPIFEQMAIDSMLLVTIAAAIEQEFKIELPLSFMEKPTISHLIGLISKAK